MFQNPLRNGITHDTSYILVSFQRGQNGNEPTPDWSCGFRFKMKQDQSVAGRILVPKSQPSLTFKYAVSDGKVGGAREHLKGGHGLGMRLMCNACSRLPTVWVIGCCSCNVTTTTYSGPKLFIVTSASSDKACNAIDFPDTLPVQTTVSPLSVGQLSFAGLSQLHSMITGIIY